MTLTKAEQKAVLDALRTGLHYAQGGNAGTPEADRRELDAAIAIMRAEIDRAVPAVRHALEPEPFDLDALVKAAQARVAEAIKRRTYVEHLGFRARCAVYNETEYWTRAEQRSANALKALSQEQAWAYGSAYKMPLPSGISSALINNPIFGGIC